MAGEINVDEIVREVLAQLAGHAVSDASWNPTVSTAKVKESETKNTAAKNELRIDARVVSLAELDGRLEGVTQITVCNLAVLTPAARDLLRQKKISVGYRIEQKSTAAIRHTLSIGLAETRFEPTLLVRMLSESGTAVEQIARSGLASVTDELCDLAAKSGHLCLLLTGQTAASVCLANRQRGVRAVLGVNVKSVSEAVSAIGANVLIVDSSGRSAFELRQMVREFIKPGERRCPSDWLARLG